MLEYTDFIRSTFAMIETRKQCQQIRKQMLTDAVYKVRTELIKRSNKNVDMLGSAVLNKDKMAELKATLVTISEEDEEEDISFRNCLKVSRKKFGHIYKMVLVRIKSLPKKWPGVHLHGPPRHTISASIASFVWVFLGMLMILKMSSSISPSKTFAFEGSWYSSTLCIMFAL
jgi:hypothetical protein